MVEGCAVSGEKISALMLGKLRMRPKLHSSLAVVMVAPSTAIRTFVAKKAACAGTLGIWFSAYEVTEEGECARLLESLSRDASVGGIVLQLPLPHGWNRERLIACIAEMKDVDCLRGVNPLIEAPVVLAVREILASRGKKITDFHHVAVIGAGFLVGVPVVVWLKKESVAYEVIDIDTPNGEGIIRLADLVISGVGKAGVCDAVWLKSGAGAIDFGFPPDFNQSALEHEAHRLSFYTPTPYGTGPVLVSALFTNLFALCG